MTLICDILPNPFDKNSTLVDLQRKGLMLTQASIIPGFIRNIVFLIITAYFLIVVLDLDVLSVLLVIGYSFLLSFVYVLISLRFFKSLNTLPTPDNNSGLYSWSITLKAASYEVIKRAMGLVGSISIVIVMFYVFPDLYKVQITMPNFTIPALTNIEFKISVLNILYLWVFVYLISLLSTYIKFRLMKNLKMTDSFAENDKLLLQWKTKFEFIISNINFSMFIVGFLLVGVPLIVLIPFIFIYILMYSSAKRELQGLKSLSFDQNSQLKGFPEAVDYIKPFLEHSKEDRNSSTDKNVKQNEDIKTIIYGVMRVAPDLKGVFRVTGGGSYGVGLAIDRENSLVVTNHRFLFIEIPVTGGNTIVGELNYNTMNIFYNRKEIREKGEKYIKSVHISQLINDSVRNYMFTDINNVTVDSHHITIKFLNGDKYKCAYFDKDYKATLKETLTQCLGEKVLFKR